MNAFVRGILLIISLAIPFSYTYGQATSSSEEDLFTIDTPITIDFNEEEEEEAVAIKKKKAKKGVFYNIKTRKGYTKKGYGDDVELELFHVLKEWEDPNPYVQQIYWYDLERGTIRSTKSANKQKGLILHGPYKRTRGKEVIEEGIFYKGTKHGRWMTYDKNGVLLDKKKFYKGWPKESLVRYYDEDRTKLKEIIPMVYGKKEGSYYYFYENGNIAVRGKYSNDNKVGVWTEYFPFRSRRKKEVQFAEDAWDEEFQSYILREWNERGRVIYDRLAFVKKAGV